MRKFFVHVFFIVFCLSYIAVPAFADTVSDLQSKIDDRNAQIKQLEDEIAQYNIEVINTNKQAKTLQSTLKSLDLTKKKINADITLTESKISKASLTIDQLTGQIGDTQTQIASNKKLIAYQIREVQNLEDQGVLQILLSSKNIADVWNDIATIQSIQTKLKTQSDGLRTLSTDLQDKQKSITDQKNKLLSLRQDLNGKQLAVQQTAQEKANLLAQTKNKEDAFKQLVKTKEDLKNQFEQEVYNFESQLKLEVDKGSYPAPHNGILSWPLDDVYVTQRFGKTVGAEKLYVSGSHNGVDFRATPGTPVKSVLGGTVVGTGNTDIYPGCYSFGKWVMVKHPNGLSTIYGHLSSINVTQGQDVTTGQVIGYSGNTGYSTGPHLHISLYATQGVRIEKYVNSRGCKQAIIPLADIKAYLDPLAYFPVY